MSEVAAAVASRRSSATSKPEINKTVVNGVKPLRAFGVARAHFMFPAARVGKVSGHCHVRVSPQGIFW
jgi:hypothetical protein